MLIELRAENYAVIDHAIAVFGPGLNLLTGETGAGKSILVDALALLMGGKSSVEVVRHGADKATVSCVFESTATAEAWLLPEPLKNVRYCKALKSAASLATNARGIPFVPRRVGFTAPEKLVELDSPQTKMFPGPSTARPKPRSPPFPPR